MSSLYDDLLETAERLLDRRAGKPGRLPAAQVRRSVSTTYYAIFHFLALEATRRIVGSEATLRSRRQILARSLTHAGLRVALEKLSGQFIDSSVEEFLRPSGIAGRVMPPAFAQIMARTFADAQTRRFDADYDLNATLSERDARLLLIRVRLAIRYWRVRNDPAERDFKHALAVLMLMKGQLRANQRD